MPRYYLHIRAGDHRFEDPDGIELPDLKKADAEALERARRVLANRITAAALVGAARLEIADANGAIVGVLSPADAAAIGGELKGWVRA